MLLAKWKRKIATEGMAPRPSHGADFISILLGLEPFCNLLLMNQYMQVNNTKHLTKVAISHLQAYSIREF